MASIEKAGEKRCWLEREITNSINIEYYVRTYKMKISKEKKDKISEQILSYLFSIYPKAIFTSYIAKEIIRDEEFTKKLLISLKRKKLVIEIKKNPQGIPYIRRSRWMLGREVYKAYKEHQNF